MKTAVKSFVCSSLGFILTLGFAVAAAGQDTNRLETGGRYDIMPPSSNMMFQITNNETNSGDDNLVWSHSGRMLAIDRSDPNTTIGPPKYICLLDVRNLGNVQVLGPRSSAVTNPMHCNITDWTWNDDRVIFGSQPQAGNPPVKEKVRLMSCVATGSIYVAPFFRSDPQANPTNHVYSPSVIFDPGVNKERLLCLVSSAQNDMPNDNNPATRINLFTAVFDHGNVPNWNNRVQLTRFNNNVPIESVKWCPELGTNYQPIANRLVMLLTFPGVDNNKLIVFNNVQSVIANPDTAPTNLLDPRFVIVETNLTMNSQVTWTYDGQYVMYGRSVSNIPPAPPSSDLYSMRADSSTNTAVKFEVPSSITGGNKQWLSISPDGMKAAFTVDHKAYVIPLQFDNIAVTGAVVTNVLTDASYTAVDVSGDAIPSNTVFSIVAPPSVDTNNFNGEFSGYAREFSVSGVSSQFDLLTNATMTLHFSQADIPSDASVTNLAIYVYNPQGTNAGQTGTWDKLDSVIDTNKQTITCEAEHFSIYAIGRASAHSETDYVEGDFDGDRLADPYVVDAQGRWYIFFSTGHYQSSGAIALGQAGWQSVAGDFDGDGLADPAMVDASGNWYIWFSGSHYQPSGAIALGQTGSPVTGDIDGDGKADPAMVDASGNWYIWFSGSHYQPSGAIALGQTGSPVTGDIDGDRKADPTMVDSSGNWYIWFSGSHYQPSGAIQLGNAGWKPVVADFDGDGKADLATVSNNYWGFRFSSGSYALVGPILLSP